MNPWTILGGLLLWLGSVTAVGLWQRHDGAASTKAAYEARDNKALTDANALILTLENKNRAIEHEHAEQIAAIGEAHEKDRNALEARRVRDIADARSGAIRLRVPGGCEAPRDSAPEDPAPAAERDVAERGVLPSPLAAALLELADDADSNTVQLGACQAVIRSYLKE